MNVKDYEDDFLDDESWEDDSRGPRKFRIPRESKHRDKNKKKQNIRKQREQKERMRQRLDEQIMEDEEDPYENY